jgi:hypothetical protein
MAKGSKLTSAEVRRAIKRGIFTITSETERGYYVTCFRTGRGGTAPERISQSTECVRPSTVRRYGENLVRAALAAALEIR